MSESRSRGKRRRSPSPFPLSQLTRSRSARREGSSLLESGSPQRTRSSKRLRQSFPASGRNFALVKAETISSSSKGMAGLTALINSAKVSAASAETNRGRKSGKPVGKARRVTSYEDNSDDVYAIGTIVFIVVGIEPNTATGNSTSLDFQPAYRLRSDVDISPVALTGMIQSGLAVRSNSGFPFLATDSYSMCDEKIRNLFPRLFHWILENEPDDATDSSWLVCMKPPYKKRIEVYSDDHLPKGFDIITSCQLAKSKAGIRERTLYLATRDPVPRDLLLQWRPQIKSRSFADSDMADVSDSEKEVTDEESSSSTEVIEKPSEDEVEEDIITISSDDEPTLIANAPTPPHVEHVENTFFMSMNLEDDNENPWH